MRWKQVLQNTSPLSLTCSNYAVSGLGIYYHRATLMSKQYDSPQGLIELLKIIKMLIRESLCMYKKYRSLDTELTHHLV